VCRWGRWGQCGVWGSVCAQCADQHSVCEIRQQQNAGECRAVPQEANNTVAAEGPPPFPGATIEAPAHALRRRHAPARRIPLHYTHIPAPGQQTTERSERQDIVVSESPRCHQRPADGQSRSMVRGAEVVRARHQMSPPWRHGTVAGAPPSPPSVAVLSIQNRDAAQVW